MLAASTLALTTIPGEASFRFIGEAGANVYMLPQAVLGKHVHGDIDPTCGTTSTTPKRTCASSATR